MMSDMGKRFYLETFGCQMNKLDGELMLGELIRDGWTETSESKGADLVLFVTCAVRLHAEEKFYSHLGACRRLKARKPGMVVAVAGCVAQKEGMRLIRRAPFVDLVCGTRRIADIARLVERVRASGEALVAVEEDKVVEIPERHGGVRRSRFQAFVSVMRGCDNFCTYCIVPYVRGPVVSRSPGKVVEEVRGLVEEGVLEVTLLGQNISAYGSDEGRRGKLAGLLEKVAAVKGLRRLKFITSHPKWTTEDIFRVMAADSVVAPFLHMPPQSGSDRVLGAMKRGYTRAFYLELVEKARRLVPELEISGDFIVGFPGERDEDFADTLDLIRRVDFKNVFAFKYSPRPPARSASFEDDVPPAVKRERLAELLALARELSHKRLSRMTGTRVEVLVEGPSKTDPEKFIGRTATDIIVIIDRAPGLEGRFVEVEIERASPVALYGAVRSGN